MEKIASSRQSLNSARESLSRAVRCSAQNARGTTRQSQCGECHEVDLQRRLRRPLFYRSGGSVIIRGPADQEHRIDLEREGER
ncbi:MAG: hypothetical protein OXF56_06485, partial [Rhodobacteraceae bacterium]|nr:hypothetical protein [Paracoccaceae bacterium]